MAAAPVIDSLEFSSPVGSSCSVGVWKLTTKTVSKLVGNQPCGSGSGWLLEKSQPWAEFKLAGVNY